MSKKSQDAIRASFQLLGAFRKFAERVRMASSGIVACVLSDDLEEIARKVERLAEARPQAIDEGLQIEILANLRQFCDTLNLPLQEEPHALERLDRLKEWYPKVQETFRKLEATCQLRYPEQQARIPWGEAVKRLADAHEVAPEIAEGLLEWQIDEGKHIIFESGGDRFFAEIPLAESMGEASIPEPCLSSLQQDILRVLIEEGATNSDHRLTSIQVADKLCGADDNPRDADTVKNASGTLRQMGLIESKPGRGGGYWLTAEGQSRARRLQQKV